MPYHRGTETFLKIVLIGYLNIMQRVYTLSWSIACKIEQFQARNRKFFIFSFFDFFKFFHFLYLAIISFLSRLMTTIKKLLGYWFNLSQDNRKDRHGELSILFRSKVIGFRTVISQFQATLIESPAIPSFTVVVSSNSFYIPAYRNISHIKLSVLGDRCLSKT